MGENLVADLAGIAPYPSWVESDRAMIAPGFWWLRRRG
jgi:hypothetical protein